MVNYHTSTLLESSEHVFELIRYKCFGESQCCPTLALVLNNVIRGRRRFEQRCLRPSDVIDFETK